MIYCSREDIPSSSIVKNNNRLKVVFIVGYFKNYLKKFIKLPPHIMNLENQMNF